MVSIKLLTFLNNKNINKNMHFWSKTAPKRLDNAKVASAKCLSAYHSYIWHLGSCELTHNQPISSKSHVMKNMHFWSKTAPKRLDNAKVASAKCLSAYHSYIWHLGSCELTHNMSISSKSHVMIWYQ